MKRYWTLTLLGVGVFLACLVTFCLTLTDLLEIGTCASGGAYVIARECPEGTGLEAALLAGSIIGLFVALGLVLAAGDRPGRRGPGSLIIVHGWTAFFSVTGAVALHFSQTADGIPPDSKLGGTIVGVTFLAMGLPGLWFVWVDIRGMLRGHDEGPKFGPRAMGLAERGLTKASGSRVVVAQARAKQGGGGRSTDERLDQLERLERLRKAGTVNDAEFAQEKARIFGS